MNLMCKTKVEKRKWELLTMNFAIGEKKTDKKKKGRRKTVWGKLRRAGSEKNIL